MLQSMSDQSIMKQLGTFSLKSHLNEGHAQVACIQETNSPVKSLYHQTLGPFVTKIPFK